MSRPARVLVVATKNILENPFRDLALVEALAVQGAKPTLALLGKNLSSFGYSPRDVETLRSATGAAVFLDSLREYWNLLHDFDAVLLGCWRDNKRLVHLANALGKLVIEHDATSGLDEWSFGSNALLLKGPFSRRMSETSYSQRYPHMAFAATGSIAHERPRDEKVSERETFYRRYRLDPSRKTAAFFPKGIKVFEDKLKMWFPDKGEQYNAWYLKRYDAICRAVRDAGLNLIVKLHPAAYASYRTQRDLEYDFWRQYPWAAILEPDDTYACYLYTEVGISIVSHSALDYGYFRKPFIYVDSDLAPMPEAVNNYLRQGNCALPLGPSRAWGTYTLPVHFPSWVGAACRADELAELLASGQYDDLDSTHYDQFITEFWCSDDGKSSERIANYVLTALEKHRPKTQLRKLARLVWEALKENTSQAGRAEKNRG